MEKRQKPAVIFNKFCRAKEVETFLEYKSCSDQEKLKIRPVRRWKRGIGAVKLKSKESLQKEK